MSNRCYYELQTYRVISQDKAPPLQRYLETAAIPAWNRQGVQPVGLLRTVYGPDMGSIHVLLPHADIESFAGCRDRLLADGELKQARADILGEGVDGPPYVRIESQLMVAFPSMPGLELPQDNSQRRTRIFELRIYESADMLLHKKKIEMFDKAGEIEIFRRTGLRPVLFAETLIGPRLPNLVYMLTFDSMVERDQAWEKFKGDPDWVSLSKESRYAGTVSSISDLILSPTAGSQM